MLSPKSATVCSKVVLRFLPKSVCDRTLFPNSILTGEMSVFLAFLFSAAICVKETVPVILPSSSSLPVAIAIDLPCFSPSIMLFLIAADCILYTIASPATVPINNFKGLLSIGNSITNIDIIMIISIFFAIPLSGFFCAYAPATIGTIIATMPRAIPLFADCILASWRMFARSACVALLEVPSSF